jgi:hypothetical protein
LFWSIPNVRIPIDMTSSTPALSDTQLLNEIQRRAFLYFWETADSETGLVNDRAGNFADDSYTVASITSTGYGLAALPIAVERGWVGAEDAMARAGSTLRFLLSMPNERGWMMHFVDKRSGAQAWESETSSIDTALLIAGAWVCGEYFGPNSPVAEMADLLYRRIDWWWMLTNNGNQPEKRVLSHGWRPVSGFIQYDYGAYSEAILLILLGLGAGANPLPVKCWQAIQRPIYAYGGIESLRAGPIFIHQMPAGYFDFRGQRDRLGFDYWVSSIGAVRIDRKYCADHSFERKTYQAGFWGLNASDGPDGYAAYGAYDAREDGTVSPTGAIASISLEPGPAIETAQALYKKQGKALWGRYGFANAFNLDRTWVSPDVIGIDLGMALLSIENYRTGLIWELTGRFQSVTRGLAAAGFHSTQEPDPRPLLREASRGGHDGHRAA